MTEAADTQQLASLCVSIEKCLESLRSLKQNVLGVQNTLAEKLAEIDGEQQSSEISLENLKEILESAARQISDAYDKIEAEAKSLPAQTPNSLMVSKLNHFLLDCTTSQDSREVYCDTRNVFDFADSTATFVNFTYEFFKMANTNTLTQQRSRKLTLAHQWSVSDPSISLPSEPSSYAQQRKFEMLLSDLLQKLPTMRTADLFCFRISLNFLEQSALSSVIEVRFLSVPKNNYKTADGQPVCLLKLLMLVNNGVIDYLYFVAPHEEWHYAKMPNIGNRRQIDLSVPSRYELYQKFTVYGNAVVNLLPHMQTIKLFHAFFMQLFRLYTIDQRCSRCGKRLKEFAPVTTTDPMPKNLVHLSCK